MLRSLALAVHPSWRTLRHVGIVCGLAAALAACTTAQEQQALDEFKTLCSSIQPTAAIVVAVTSDVGLSWASGAITGGAAIAAGVCSATESIVENTINEINSLNGTAQISISQQGGNPAAIEALARKYRGLASSAHRSVSVRGGKSTVTWTFVVPPHHGIL